MIIGGRTYEVAAPAAIQASVVFVIPTMTPALATLAIDAVRRFTNETDYHVLIVDTGATMSRRQRVLSGMIGYSRVSVMTITPPVQRWWRLESRRSVGSLINGVALEAARRWLATQQVQWMFAMHDDAFPAKPGWLSWLMKQDGVDAFGVKRSERNGLPHASGVLFGMNPFGHMPDDLMLPRLPLFDVAEWATAWRLTWGLRVFCANSVSIRRDNVELLAQTPGLRLGPWTEQDCDVSVDDDGEVFYVHLGGGTLNGRDMGPRIAWARRNLGL